MQQHYMMIINVDGTIPFDDDLAEHHKTNMLGHLTQMGHQLQRDGDSWKSLNHKELNDTDV